MRAAVDHDTAHLRTHDLGLTEVDPVPDLQAELVDALAHLGRGSDPVRRSSKGSEEPVPGGVELATVVPPKRLPDQSVVRGNERAPPPVPDLLGDLRRRHDVGEQHGDELGGPSPRRTRGA